MMVIFLEKLTNLDYTTILQHLIKFPVFLMSVSKNAEFVKIIVLTVFNVSSLLLVLLENYLSASVHPII